MKSFLIYLFRIVKRHVYVPTHFFGEIVKLKSGYEHLQQTVSLFYVINLD